MQLLVTVYYVTVTAQHGDTCTRTAERSTWYTVCRRLITSHPSLFCSVHMLFKPQYLLNATVYTMPHSKKTSTHQLEASGLFCGSFVASAHRRDTGERAAPPAAAEGPPGAEPDFSGRFTGGWWYGPQGHGEVAAARIRYPVCIFFTTVSESTNGSTCTRYDTSLIHKIRFPKIRFMFISQSIVIVNRVQK